MFPERDSPRSSANDAFRTVDPATVRIPPCPAAPPPEKDFVRSVGRNGVLMPILAAEDPDGSLVLVSGRRRALAAAEVDVELPVRILTGSEADHLRVAFNEDYHVGHKRSTIERAWQVRAFLAAAQEEDLPISTRWLADQLAVSVGTAHNWWTIARGLPPERLERLALESGVDSDKLRQLPTRQALRLATIEGDEEAEGFLRELKGPSEPPAADVTSLWVRGLRLVRRLVVRLRRALAWVFRRVPRR